MAEPQNRGNVPDRRITDARNLAAHLLLNRNFTGSWRTVLSARNVSGNVDTNKLKFDEEEVKNAQIKKNCDKAVVDKVRYTMDGLDARHKACIERRDKIGDWFENRKPDRSMVTKFGILFTNFEVFCEQNRLIELTTKVGRETSPFLTEAMISSMEKSLDTFEHSIENEYVMDEIYDNLFGLRDICHDDLQQLCVTLIPLEKNEKPIYVRKDAERYQPLDLMYMTQMLRIEKHVEALKFLTLTSDNHHAMNILRLKIVGRSRGMPADVMFPIPNVPLDSDTKVDDICRIKSQNYLNHCNEFSSLIYLFIELDETILSDINIQFVNWLESLRQMSAVVLGNVAEKVFSLDEKILSDDNTWVGALYYLSVCSRLCCHLLNIHKVLALHVDKKNGLYGKATDSLMIENRFNRILYHLDNEFDRERVDNLLLQLQKEVVELATQFLTLEEPLCSEVYKEAPDVSEFNQQYNFESTTLRPENFPPLMQKYSKEIFHQLALEKHEVHRLAGHHECIKMLFAKEDIDKTEFEPNVLGAYVDSFSTNVEEYLSRLEVAKAFADGKKEVMDHPFTEHLANDLATMARNVAGNTKLFRYLKLRGFSTFNNRFRIYVGTAVNRMKETSGISMFFFAFMWQAVAMRQDQESYDRPQPKHVGKLEKFNEEAVKQGLPIFIDLSDELQALFNNWAILAAERFLVYADSRGIFNPQATRTPIETLLYRFLINAYYEPSRRFFFRTEPEKERKYGPKGILFRENTAPLAAAEEAQIISMGHQLLRDNLPLSDLNTILNVEVDIDSFDHVRYVEDFF